MRYILASWDSEGFECLQDITKFHPDEWGKDQLMDALRGNTPTKNPLGHQISMMKMRARFNSQRTPEIYIFTTEDDIEFKDVEDWMIADPQSLVDWVRENHWNKILSDYNPKKKRVIE
jgi:hypothetical protein